MPRQEVGEGISASVIWVAVAFVSTALVLAALEKKKLAGLAALAFSNESAEGRR